MSQKPRKITSKKFVSAQNTLPEELWPIFEMFVEDYTSAGKRHYGYPFISYIILADMITDGWRPTAREDHS